MDVYGKGEVETMDRAEIKYLKKIEKKRFKSLDRTKISLAGEVLIFSLLAAMITALASYFVLKNHVDERVGEQRMELADRLTQDIVTTIRGYPAYEWILGYWFIHSDGMDVHYSQNEETDKKARDFCRRHPGLVIDDVRTEEITELSTEDQKEYAEIVYDRMIALLNQLKMIYEPSYLSILLMDQTYDKGTFLVSGASPDQKRGSDYSDAYVIGVTVESTPEQKSSMMVAVTGGRSMEESGDYIDSFGYVQDILGGMHVMVGVTYDISEVRGDAQTQIKSMIMIFTLLQGILAFALFILVYCIAVRPIGEIQRNVWDYRGNKDSGPVLKKLSRIKLKNELGALSADVSDLIVSIDEYVTEIRDITAEKEKIEAELSVAKKIQADMLPGRFPAFPDRNEFDLYATMDPAKEVGGDFYDFFFVDEDRICLVIADVSGKGIPASLFMVNSMNRIRNQAIRGKSPSRVLETVNEELCRENESGYFVTVWIAYVDLVTGKGVAANAGHEHPVIRRKGGVYESVVYRHAPAVAIMEGMSYEEHEFELHPGDRIFVYTDGVPEATNASEELFGEERMLQSLNSNGKDSLRELLPDLKKDIDAFVGDAVQFDDITMLGFEYLGTDRSEK